MTWEEFRLHTGERREGKGAVELGQLTGGDNREFIHLQLPGEGRVWNEKEWRQQCDFTKYKVQKRDSIANLKNSM